MRNFRKLKTISDYESLDEPELVHNIRNPYLSDYQTIQILRMLVKPKYGSFTLPESLSWALPLLKELQEYDIQRTGIFDSWCYLTIRAGAIQRRTDDQWHFDGSSFRTDIIPERNYTWVNEYPTEYMVGTLSIPNDFDPLKHNLFSFASSQLLMRNTKLEECRKNQWYLLSPFVLHRRPVIPVGAHRIFVRICFTDIEGRDVNNTSNPALYTDAYGRDPVKTFRDKLINYYGSNNVK